jgi:hypothetical protein
MQSNPPAHPGRRVHEHLIPLAWPDTAGPLPHVPISMTLRSGPRFTLAERQR